MMDTDDKPPESADQIEPVTARADRPSSGTNQRSGTASASPATSPSNSEPAALTVRVPNGNTEAWRAFTAWSVR